MDMTAFLPRELHKPLAWLGNLRPDWIIPHWNAEWNCLFSIEVPPWTASSGLTLAEHQAILQIGNLCSMDLISLYWFHALARSLAEGPKIFEPTLKQCRMMGDTEVKIPSVDPECPDGAYAQPYDAMLFKFPREYVAELGQKYGYDKFPQYAICYHDPDHKYIVCGGNYGEDLICSFVPPDPTKTIEEVMCHPLPTSHAAVLSEPERKVSQHLQRLCINACLLLMEYKTVKRPLDPKAWEKNRKGKDERNKLLALGNLEKIDFAQEFIVPDDDILPDAGHRVGGEHGHNSPTPHWRKRHWRPVAHGVGRLLRRRTLIHRVYVNKHLLTVDPSVTSVTFKGKSKIA